LQYVTHAQRAAVEGADLGQATIWPPKHTVRSLRGSEKVGLWRWIIRSAFLCVHPSLARELVNHWKEKIICPQTGETVGRPLHATAWMQRPIMYQT